MDDASNCRNKAAPIEFYYLDNRANLFKKCYKTCKYCFGEGTDIFHNCSQCIDGYVQTPDTKNCLAQEYVEQMKENIKEAYKNSTLINENGMTIQIYNTSKEGIEEVSDTIGNISSIDFRECENILKQHYNISGWNILSSKSKRTSPTEEFENLKFRDSYKKEFALSNGYEYLEIPYWLFTDESYKHAINDKINYIVSNI